MELSRAAGTVIIAGFILFVANMLMAPPRLYQETDIDVRLGIIAKQSSRWQLAQWTGGFAPVLTAIGFILVTFALPEPPNRWFTNLGTGAFVLAGLFSLLYTYRIVADPRTYFASSGITPLSASLILLLAAAGVLHGLSFLQTDLPTWLGSLTLGSAALIPLTLVIKHEASYLLLILFFTITLVVGIVLLGFR